ncbi:6530_t:CDS:2, partial [Cetraspora pellucida]
NYFSMLQVSYINRQNKISSALNELNNSANPKCPSINSVAKNFGLSEATLRHAAKNGGPSKHRNPSTILTKHKKNQLVGYCINMQWLGFGLTKSGINHCVMEIMDHNKRLHPFGDKGPGRDWWTRFMRDHPKLSFCIPQELSKAYVQRANATIIKDHFDKLKQIINENSLTVLQVWNIDETEFVLVPKLKKVFAKKGSHQVHKVAYKNSHEHISVVPTISAAGSCIPPLIIYKGSRTILSLLQGAPPGTPSGISFAKLKKEFGKQYDNYHNTTSKVVTKHTFAKLFGPAFIDTYISLAICNAFRATGIWPFNSKAISPDCLDPSLATECFDIMLSSDQPSQPTIIPSSDQYLQPIIVPLSSQSSQLVIISSSTTKEELKTYKSPRTSSLHSVLRYNFSCALQAETLDIPLEIRQESGPSPKKRKTFLFAQLLTNDESWQKLKEANEETEKKLEEAKQKKELAAQKKMEWQQNLEQKGKS